jgi:hypothetical protein
MSVLPKGFGDHESANAPKDQEGEDKEPCEPEEVPCILKKFHEAVSEKEAPRFQEKSNVSWNTRRHHSTGQIYMSVCERAHKLM